MTGHSYAEIEAVLAAAHCHDPAVDQRGAFRGRLKHLQRLGIPLGRQPGKGSKRAYSDDDILQIHFALQLERFGFWPAVLSEWMHLRWDFIASMLWHVADAKSFLAILPQPFGQPGPLRIMAVTPADLLHVMNSQQGAVVMSGANFYAVLDKFDKAAAA